MRGFRSTKTGISATFSAAEAGLLAELGTQIATLLESRDGSRGDPALERLLPAAYRDSEDDAAEFRRFTEGELVDEKLGNALALAAALGAEPVDGKVRVILDAPTAFAWLRSFNDIRLTLAARLGIEQPEPSEPGFEQQDTSAVRDEQSRYNFAVYNWLGALQYSLVRAVDR
jgi:hypothetical protein